ncbi:MAG: hypothetical protein GC168_14850 [Candidatus Hydrogenedens sp.]|nr:hypothetical protein [Candidatus Hydrogenedens sp.]
MRKQELKEKMAQETRAEEASRPAGKHPASIRRPDAVSIHQTVPEQTGQVLDVLAAEPDHGFVLYGGRPFRIVHRSGRAALEEHTCESLLGYVGRRVGFQRRGKDGEWMATDPSRKLADDILSLPEFPDGIPRVHWVKSNPLLTADGELIAASGLHPEHGTYLDLPPELEGMTLPAVINRKVLLRARDTILDPFHDFPVHEDSVADLVALLFTMVLRERVEGVTPLFIVDANVPGTGKGLLCKVLSLIAYGHEGEFSPADVAPDELRKRLFALVSSGALMHVLDNAERRIWAPELAAFLTSEFYGDRRLGESTYATYPNHVVLIVTGNNVQVGGDIRRRCALIRLASDHPSPEERTDFRHANLLAYVREHRRKILRAVYTLAAKWLRDGRPLPEAVPTLGSFEAWVSFCSGLLHTADATGLLESRAELRARDHDAEEYELMLSRAHDRFGGDAFTARDLASALDPDERPTVLFAPHGGDLNKRMGRLLTRIAGRAFGEDGLTIRDAGKVDKTKRYRVDVRTAARREESSHDK